MLDPSDQSTPRSERVGAFYGGVVAIVVGALAVRLLYLWQIEWVPFFYDLVGDGKAYWEWAGRLAAGDWWGRHPFYQAPAYPYFLGLVRCLVGPQLGWVHVVQAGLGALACGVLALAGRAWFSSRAGLCTGALLACYAPAVFFDGLIQKATLSLFFMALLLWLLGLLHRSKAIRQPSLRRLGLAFAAGLVLGLLALTREQALLLGLLILLWLALKRAGQRRLAVPFVVGVAVVLGLVGWRNYRVGGEFALTTVQAGPNFYIGNHAGATGRYIALRPGAEWPPLERQAATELAEAAVGHPLTPREVSHYWLEKSWHFIRHQPGSWLRLLLRKWAMVWNAYELSDTESFTLYAHVSWLLGALGRINHFGILCPLAVLGLVTTWSECRRLALLYGMVLALAGGVALFFVFARYRYPLVPLLMLFAGAGVTNLIRSLQAAYASSRPTGPPPAKPSTESVVPGRKIAFGLGLAVVVAGVTNLPWSHQRDLDAAAYENWAVVVGRQGNYTASAYLFRQALCHRPDSATLRTSLAGTLAAAGQTGEAAALCNEALRLDPDNPRAHYFLGKVLAEQGRLDEALDHFRAAVAAKPDFDRAYYRMAEVLARLGRIDEAIQACRSALRINPRNPAAHKQLGALLEQQGHPTKADALPSGPLPHGHRPVVAGRGSE